MKKRFAAVFVALALAFTSLGVTAAPALAAELPTIKINVDAENGSYDGYEIDDNSITLSKTNVVYELSGNTEKQVIANNSDTPTDQFFYLRLNNVMITGGIAAQDMDNFCLSINVPNGTSNNVETLKALTLYMYGGGELFAESLDVGASSVNASTAGESYLSVVDTQIEVQHDEDATKSCVWMGSAQLSGNASVTYVSSGDYAPLRVLDVGKCDEVITIKDNAKLYCLQADADTPSDKVIDGLQIVEGKLLLQDNASLQAEARPWTEDYPEESGAAVLYGDSIEVKDNAEIEASAYGCAIKGDDLIVSGKDAYVYAESKYACGIDAVNVSISKGARVDASGKSKGMNILNSLSIDGATLFAESKTANAVTSETSISLKNAVVGATPASGFAAFSAAGEMIIDGSLIELSAGSSLGGTATNSIVFIGDEGTVFGNAALLGRCTVTPGRTLTVPTGASLTIPAGNSLRILEGATFVNNGTVHVLGTLENEGTIVCNSHCGGTATCHSRAVCDVCQTEYGEFDSTNHANLKHMPAVSATATTEGNIEYWFCEACGKYYADAAAEKEITQASTITAKLSEQKPANDNPDAGSDNETEPTANKESAKTQLPATGDANNVAFALAAALASIAALAGGVLVSRRLA